MIPRKFEWDGKRNGNQQKIYWISSSNEVGQLFFNSNCDFISQTARRLNPLTIWIVYTRNLCKNSIRYSLVYILFSVCTHLSFIFVSIPSKMIAKREGCTKGHNYLGKSGRPLLLDWSKRIPNLGWREGFQVRRPRWWNFPSVAWNGNWQPSVKKDRL